MRVLRTTLSGPVAGMAHGHRPGRRHRPGDHVRGADQI